jgi:hypothetical protein
MTAFCTSCGARMQAEDRHCPRCGRLQTGTLVVRSLPMPEPEMAPDEETDGRGPDRRLLVALAVAGLLMVFLVGIVLGRSTVASRGGEGGQAAATTTSTPTPSARSSPTQPPSPTPSATPAAPSQFTLVSARITNNGVCSTANGCGVAGTFRNQGSARGSGTARLSVGNADGSKTYAGCTAPIPPTDPGATVEVSCQAQSPELAAFLPSGNYVYPRGSGG